MVNSEITKEWLDKADEDFEFASINLEEGSKFFSQMCFHFQQAAEKYLKAFIIAHKLPFKKIHDLQELLEICLEFDSSFSELKEECIFLTDFYIDTRYPVHWPTNISEEERRKLKKPLKELEILL